MADKKKIDIENYFKTDCDVDTSIRQAYERGFNRAYEKCMSLVKNKQDCEFSTESNPVRVGDILWLFSDGYSNIIPSVEISDYNGYSAFFEATTDLIEMEIFDNLLVSHLYIVDDNTLEIKVKKIFM